MTREEFDEMPSRGDHPCPDCGEYWTHPTPNCGCPRNPSGFGNLHINRWHHTCDSERAEQ